MPALGEAAAQHTAAILGAHALQEAMPPLADDQAGLVGALGVAQPGQGAALGATSWACTAKGRAGQVHPQLLGVLDGRPSRFMATSRVKDLAQSFNRLRGGKAGPPTTIPLGRLRCLSTAPALLLTHLAVPQSRPQALEGARALAAAAAAG